MRRSITNLLKAIGKGRQQTLAPHLPKPVRPRSDAKSPIDWQHRRLRKNHLFGRWILVLGALLLVSVLFFALPLLVIHPPLRQAVLVAIPPTLFAAASWMVAAWYTYDKSRQLAMILTIGMTPVRLAVFVGWVWLLTHVPGLPIRIVGVAMMVF